jgi:hypothetical protein
MIVDKFREVLDANPFQPFLIHMADGRWLPVMSREFVNLSPSGRVAVVFQADDSMNLIDLLLVTSLEVKPMSRPSQNGPPPDGV